MRPEDSVGGTLWDMRIEASRTLRFIGSDEIESFLGNEMLQTAVKYQLEALGELTQRLPDSYRALHPEVPWSRIVGQRNIIVHDYGRLDLDLLWDTATRFVPKLLEDLDRLIQEFS